MRNIFLAAFLLLAACSSQPSDNELRSQLIKTLSASYSGVIPAVKDGVVTLSGTCPDESCKHASETAARSVKGVKDVVNEVVVSSPPAAH